MTRDYKARAAKFPVGSILALTVLLTMGRPLLALRGSPIEPQKSGAPTAEAAVTPWTSAQTVRPEDLVKELADSRIANRPTVVCVGFPTLYRAAHVPGASFHGPAYAQAGVDDLRKWAQGLPRSTSLVVYCGCCPMADCPNIRPAFTVLREMGFTHVRVLVIPNSFATDWIEKGYPIERGSSAVE